MESTKNILKYATTDIASYNRTLYCRQNDPLEIVSQNGIVAIVETAKKERFPVLVELLSDEMVVVLVEEVVKEVKEHMELW